MLFRELLDWLSEFDPHTASLSVQRSLVGKTLAGLEGQQLTEELELAREALLDALAELQEGRSAGEILDGLLFDFGHLRQSPGEQLEQDLLTLAQRLPRWQWNVERYAQAKEGVKLAEAGDLEGAEGLFARIEAALERGWEPYYNTPVAPDEVTMEAVIGHRLLARACQTWFDALAALREGNYAEGLQMAEDGSRLLAAAQRYAARLERQVQYLGV